MEGVTGTSAVDTEEASGSSVSISTGAVLLLTTTPAQLGSVGSIVVQ